MKWCAALESCTGHVETSVQEPGTGPVVMPDEQESGSARVETSALESDAGQVEVQVTGRKLCAQLAGPCSVVETSLTHPCGNPFRPPSQSLPLLRCQNPVLSPASAYLPASTQQVLPTHRSAATPTVAVVVG